MIMQEQQVELRLRERQSLGLADMEGSQAAAFAFGSLHLWCVNIALAPPTALTMCIGFQHVKSTLAGAPPADVLTIHAGSVLQCSLPVQMAKTSYWRRLPPSVSICRVPAAPVSYWNFRGRICWCACSNRLTATFAGCAVSASALHRLHTHTEGMDDAADRSCTRAWLQQVESSIRAAAFYMQRLMSALHCNQWPRLDLPYPVKTAAAVPTCSG